MIIHILTEAGDFIVTEGGDRIVTEDSVPDATTLAVYPDPFRATAVTSGPLGAAGADPFESGSRTSGGGSGCGA